MEWIFDHLILEVGLFIVKTVFIGWKLLGGKPLPEVLTFDDLEE